MIYLLWAAVVGLAAVVVYLWYAMGVVCEACHLAFDSAASQRRLNDQFKEKLRLVGQHID